MPHEPDNGAAAVAEDATIAARALAAGDGWSLWEYVCRAGPDDRPFEERHEGFSISAVLEGRFAYRGERGAGLLYPGALLLGNAGRCFQCRHDHGRGDRCVSVNLRDDLFGELAAAAAGGAGYAFDRPSLPPSSAILPVVSSLERAGARTSAWAEEAVFAVVERTLAALTDWRAPAVAPLARETRRIAAALAYIEEDLTRDLSLAELAAFTGMSRYHFLRVFTRVVGMTPRQYVIAARLRRAAEELAASRRPVLEIALDAGFGDLSTFNRRFRATYGEAPQRFRAAAT